VTASLAVAAVLVGVHVFAGRLRFVEVIPRSRFLSLSGGMAVAYVFLRILPDLGVREARVGGHLRRFLRVIPHDPVYVVALLGLIVFYGLHRLAERSRAVQRREAGEDCPGPGAFWIGIASFSIVNFAVGYLVYERAEEGTRRLLLFALAMAVWFVVNDHGLRVDFRERYRRVGRWVLAVAVLSGWAVAAFSPVSDLVLSIAVAFVGGGIVMNVLKEELPRERESRFWAFTLGALLYSVLLLAV
jgi:hypothetical protein